MNYWLCVTDERNWNIVKRKNIWGVKKCHAGTMMSVKESDQLVFYVKPTRIGGIFEATSKPFQEDKVIFKGEVFPYRLRISPTIVPDD